jgi:NodT family efflux transporter outer membrane factor (OMF) lipoprotein
VGPDYSPPEVDLPDQWHQTLTDGLYTGEGNLHSWWTSFEDPILNDLISRSREGNLNLKVAAARIEEARAILGFSKSDWFPDVQGLESGQRTRISEGIVETMPPGSDRHDNFFSTGLGVGWELDFWGRIRRSVEASSAGFEASIEDYRDLLVILYADVAANYIDARTFQRRIYLALENIQSQSETLKLTRDRNKAGLAPDLDVSQAELNLARTESSIPVMRIFLIQTLNRLGLLLGTHPSALHEQLSVEGGIPESHANPLLGLPADLMRQRPDLRRAERELAAQTARIGVATADLYPQFSLLGSFTLDATQVQDVFNAGSLAYSLGPSMRWNLFNGGRVRSVIRAEDARAMQSMHFYEQTVLSALEEVENSLVAFAQEQDRLKALERAVTAAKRSVDLVKTLYKTGLTDFQNVLDMERTLFLQQDEMAVSKGSLSLDQVRIYKSLGGGWLEVPRTITASSVDAEGEDDTEN